MDGAVRCQVHSAARAYRAGDAAPSILAYDRPPHFMARHPTRHATRTDESLAQLLRLLRCSVGGRRPQLAASRREQFMPLERKSRERGQNPPNPITPNTSSAEARDQQE